MQIRFTRHANDKFEVLARHGWNVLREQVENTVQNPAYLDRSRVPLYIAQASLDEAHVLRVVYREEQAVMVIITFYPGRTSQYAQ